MLMLSVETPLSLKLLYEDVEICLLRKLMKQMTSLWEYYKGMKNRTFKRKTTFIFFLIIIEKINFFLNHPRLMKMFNLKCRGINGSYDELIR